MHCSLPNLRDMVKDDELLGHSLRVGTGMGTFLKQFYGAGNMLVESAIFSGKFHDIGKIQLEPSIYAKNGALTLDEYEYVKSHASKGCSLLEELYPYVIPEKEKIFLRYAMITALTHHERWDGKGYPNGLKGNSIPFFGRVCAIIDSFDAIVNRRSYKPAYSFEHAYNEIVKGSGTQYDPRLVEIFKICYPKLVNKIIA